MNPKRPVVVGECEAAQGWRRQPPFGLVSREKFNRTEQTGTSRWDAFALLLMCSTSVSVPENCRLRFLGFGFLNNLVLCLFKGRNECVTAFMSELTKLWGRSATREAWWGRPSDWSNRKSSASNVCHFTHKYTQTLTHTHAHTHAHTDLHTHTHRHIYIKGLKNNRWGKL